MPLCEQLQALCAAPGVGGQKDIAEQAASMFRPLADEIGTDAVGNVIAWKRCDRADAPTVMLEAHMDEIGFVVTGIEENGFLRVAACGHADLRMLSAAEVVVYGDRPYAGVFCSTPPHLSDEKSELPPLEDMGIDVGLDHEQAAAHIPLGTRVGFRPHFSRLLGGRVCSKALDDRAGVAALLRCAEILQNETLPCHLAIVLAAAEELGCRGAGAAAFAVQPDTAIAVDVSFAYTPDAKRIDCGELGGGPMIGYSPTLDHAVSVRLEELAKEQNLPFQREVMGERTGTDADVITISRAGVTTGLVSIPLRYMHTPAEVVELADIEHVAQLLAAFVREGGYTA